MARSRERGEYFINYHFNEVGFSKLLPVTFLNKTFLDFNTPSTTLLGNTDTWANQEKRKLKKRYNFNEGEMSKWLFNTFLN